ncbi:hypothetical protein UPYG_G00237790 [Umbra pygmaea]|uniref:PWWP domain-containing protein n=1 Tax=Umbra pygmaea TaxID=75934 RepID=A0ABD0X2J2_UMBPY
MERIEIQGHGQRFAFWTDEDRRLLQGQLDPVYRVPRRRGITEYRPLHMQAVTDRTAEEKRLVDFIVQSKGAEQHLVGVLSGKHSYWFPLKSSSTSTVMNYLWAI